MKPTVGELFAGVGGFGLGFERAGFEVRWQVEINADCVDVLSRHWPGVKRYGDVCAVDPDELESVDVITFGSPCQDLSVAGKRAGLAGERSGLFHEATRIIAGVRPVFAIWENVTGSLSSNNGDDFAAVLAALANVGALDISWRVLDALGFGVPQRRRRVFVISDFRGERAVKVLFDGDGVQGDSVSGKPPSGGDAGSPARGTREDSGVIAFDWQKGGGGNDSSWRGKSREWIVRAGDYIGTLGVSKGDAVLVPVAFHEDQRTGSVYENGHIHALSASGGGKPGQGYPAVRIEDELRKLTPVERERAMGWPDDWTRFRGNGDELSESARQRLTGNGVVAPVAEWLAHRIAAVLRADQPSGGA